jgi:hypothetical protein
MPVLWTRRSRCRNYSSAGRPNVPRMSQIQRRLYRRKGPPMRMHHSYIGHAHSGSWYRLLCKHCSQLAVRLKEMELEMNVRNMAHIASWATKWHRSQLVPRLQAYVDFTYEHTTTHCSKQGWKDELCKQRTWGVDISTILKCVSNR